MKRLSFRHDGLTLSYLDSGGGGPVLVALHGHWMEGLTFAPLAARLAPAWRVVALDQRGHGDSDHAPSYTRDAYLGDLGALLAHLGIDLVALLGHSLGGVNAYQFAARHPDRVRGLVVEDIGAVVAADVDFVLGWAGTFPTREQLGERVGPRFQPYLEDSFRETSGGWRLAFDPPDMVTSQLELNGDHWVDWLAADCPALLIRGDDSRLTTAEHLGEMAALRPNTRLVTLHGGHVVHADDPVAFGDAVAGFLAGLGPARECVCATRKGTAHPGPCPAAGSPCSSSGSPRTPPATPGAISVSSSRSATSGALTARPARSPSGPS